MTKAKFALPKRVNDTVADEGKWVEYYSSVTDYVYGEFKIRSMDAYSKRVQAIKAEQAKAEAKLDEKKMTSEQIAAHNVTNIVTLALADWRGIKGGDGKEVPFSTENAVEYFTDDDAREVLVWLIDFAGDPRNFRDGLTKDEIAKN